MIKLELEAETFEALREKACAALGIVIGAVETQAIPQSTTPKASAQRAAPKAVTQGSNESQKPSDTTTTATTAAPDGGAIDASPSEQSTKDVIDGDLDYQRDVKPAVLKISQKLGRPGVETLLKPFDVTNAQQIPATRWPELMTAVAELMEA